MLPTIVKAVTKDQSRLQIVWHFSALQWVSLISDCKLYEFLYYEYVEISHSTLTVTFGH